MTNWYKLAEVLSIFELLQVGSIDQFGVIRGGPKIYLLRSSGPQIKLSRSERGDEQDTWRKKRNVHISDRGGESPGRFWGHSWSFKANVAYLPKSEQFHEHPCGDWFFGVRRAIRGRFVVPQSLVYKRTHTVKVCVHVSWHRLVTSHRSRHQLNNLCTHFCQSFSGEHWDAVERGPLRNQLGIGNRAWWTDKCKRKPYIPGRGWQLSVLCKRHWLKDIQYLPAKCHLGFLTQNWSHVLNEIELRIESHGIGLGIQKSKHTQKCR